MGFADELKAKDVADDAAGTVTDAVDDATS
jgi:hypothetical protein